MGYFDELLKDRNNPYEINLELWIRKLFENKTDYTFEFQKNEDKYGYDLSVYKYYLSGGDYEKILIAFIEIEVSENWENEYPQYWRDYSFLKRKVYKYDFYEDIFMNEVKDNSDKTIYIIFNKAITDSICRDMIFIKDLKSKERKLTNSNRNNWFLTTTKNDVNIIRGLNKCLNYSYKFIMEKDIEYKELQKGNYFK